jgi:ABC-type transport system involved in multi-copper enzyme maturation permease subunit
MRKLLSVIKFTLADILHQKSFLVLLIIAIVFVSLLKGCYKGNYVVNGQAVDNLKIAWTASIAAFHFVCVGVLFIAAVLSMSIFKRDREDGTAIYMLSKPLDRLWYTLGRAIGVWIVSFSFMFALHLTIFIITWMSAGGTMPGYLTASLICSVNVLFMVLLVCLLSLYISDIAAAFLGLGVALISYISDGVQQLMQTSMVQAAMGTHAPTLSWWRLAWPKISSLQVFAGSLIDKSVFQTLGPIHPAIIMAAYCILLGALLLVAFKRKEI